MRGRDAGGGCRSASGPLGSDTARLRETDESGEAARLGARDGPSERGQAVIPASLVVVRGRRPLARLGDEALLEEALDRPVERAGGELHGSSRALRHELHDRVTMPVLFGQRHEDVERGRGQWQQGLDVGALVFAGIHAVSIPIVDIVRAGSAKVSGPVFAESHGVKIFVAGATGVIGRRLIPLLVAEGHAVTAIARSSDKRLELARRGAKTVAADLF